MNASEGRAFYYGASGNPLGGVITAPVQKTVTAGGSSALGQAGGRVEASEPGFVIPGVLKVGKAWSRSSGDQPVSGAPGKPMTRKTTVASGVEALNLLDILCADAITSQITVVHEESREHPQVVFEGCEFKNLTLYGKPVNANLVLESYSRSGEDCAMVDGHWEEHPRLLGAAVAHNQRLLSHTRTPKWAINRYGWMMSASERERKGHVVCSLVKDVSGLDPDTSFAHILHVPEIGNIFLGEVMVGHGAFQVTMLRAEMGCKAEGQASIGSCSIRGATSP